MNSLEISVNGAHLLADPSGALFWPDNAMLMVADLHLEKASSYAALGIPLPPYDSAETLKRLAEVIHRLAPETVICLGDSFHDATASERLNDTDVEALKALVADRDWVWITGNHDPAPPSGLGGQSANDLVIGPLRLCHEPGPAPAPGEIAGHLHPKARVRTRGRSISGRCFATDGQRLILPAFGALTGGLDVTGDVLSALFPKRLEILLTRPNRVHRFPRSTLVQTA